jgi:pyruvate/2-oxoglutarate/acetoin dehydrogenase E1 component/TPP-dependent pyruvate/acetoin dehydrogenase alpha subunit
MSKNYQLQSIPDISVCRWMLKKMLLIRRFNEYLIPIYPTDVLVTPLHLHIGQEAVPVGLCAHLNHTDTISFSHRSHGPALAKGMQVKYLMAELYGKITGCSRSRGGSMHLVAPELGMHGSSAIVGGGIAIGAGMALASKLSKDDHISVSYFGDGATNTGIFWETLNFSALKEIPLLFVCEHNDLANNMSSKKHMYADLLSISKSFMKTFLMDGTDVLDMYVGMKQAIDYIRTTKKPAFALCKTLRWMNHLGVSYDDINCPPHIRQQNCPIQKFQKILLEKHMIELPDIQTIMNDVDQEILDAEQFAKNSPFPCPNDLMEDAKPLEQSTYLKELDESGDMRIITYQQAIQEATDQAMINDTRVFIIGLDADDPSGMFGSLKKLSCPERVIGTPISENAVCGIAMGAALVGKRPVCIHLRVDFLMPAMDMIVNYMAKWRFMFGGKVHVPLVIRAVIGKGWGCAAQHAQALHAIFAHIPGLKVVMPSLPYTAKGILLAAIKDNDPVIVIEHRRLYNHEGHVPLSMFDIPLGKGILMRKGKSLTIVAASIAVIDAISAIDQYQIDADLIDIRSISPLDMDIISTSVKKTGKLLVIDYAYPFCGLASEICAGVTEKVFSHLIQAPAKITFPNCSVPASGILEKAYYPTSDTIARKAIEMIG